MDQLIFHYSIEEALEDGVLHLEGWLGRRPLVTTQRVVTDLPPQERHAQFQAFLRWQREVEPTLPEEERLYHATVSTGARVWVIDDGAAITLLYPHEY
jgi:hypothetical protein